MIRIIAAAAIGAYVGAGLFAGLLTQRSIPALNPVGVAFIAVTWPNQIRCARADAGCSPLPPAWMAPYLFSIGERQ